MTVLVIATPKRRFWTETERAELARLYPTHTAADLASILGRTPTAVHQAAGVLGLRKQAKIKPGAEFDAAVRRLHGLGLTDPLIAAELGCERHAVSRARRRLGLPGNRVHPAYRRRVGEATRDQCRRAGVGSLAEARVRAFRDRARAAGWPEDLRPRAVQILDALMERGPMTRREIADAIGMPWKGSRKSLVSNDPEGSYLAHLMARGLVVCLGRVVRGEGRGKSVNLYDLAITTERRTRDAE